MSQLHRDRARRGLLVELGLVVATLLVAAFLRFWCPTTVPPGPSHDELRMMDLGELIVDGERPIHWEISYSAEPLFMYLLAPAMRVWGFTVFAARVVTRFGGLLLMPLVHILTRRLFGRRVALFVGGVLAVTWWPVFFSRVALRGITLPLMFVMAVYCLWRGLALKGDSDRLVESVRWGWLSSGGVLFGLTWYTFTAARGLFLLLPGVLAHLALERRVRPRQLWRIALVTIGLAALVATPFVYEVIVHPGAPETRLQQLGGVLAEMRAGNLRPLLSQTLATVGVLALRGDPNWRYNVASRAAFGPVIGTLGMLGLVIGATRWRQPKYFLLVAWLLLGWAPSMLAPEAPSFVRAIGALPSAAILAGVGVAALWDWASSRAGGWAEQVAAGLLALLLVLAGLSTYRALFVKWPVRPQVREIYQASLTEAFDDLNSSGLEGPIWMSEPFPDDRHLLLAKRTLEAPEIEPRWFDGSRSLILPPERGLRRYLFADFAPPDPLLFSHWMSATAVVLEGKPSGRDLVPAYRLYEVEGGPWVDEELTRISAGSTAAIGPAGDQPVALPAQFGDVAALVGYELGGNRLAPGQELYLVVYWRVGSSASEPLSSFAHVLDNRNRIVGQYDGFDVPWWHWEPNAVIAQVYRFAVDQSAQPGVHWVEVGLYNPDTMQRVQVVADTGGLVGDRLILEEIVVE